MPVKPSFRVGDAVIVNPGVMDPDDPTLSLAGWQGWSFSRWGCPGGSSTAFYKGSTATKRRSRMRETMPFNEVPVNCLRQSSVVTMPFSKRTQSLVNG